VNEIFLKAAVEAAGLAGEVLLNFRHKFSMREKAPRDLVTDADVAAQQTIERYFKNKFPDHAFLGEESTAEVRQAAIESGKLLWVVDPLDGTANYVHGLSMYAVSIALVRGSEVQVGVVHDPNSGCMFTATKDGPALNKGQPIRASSCTALNYAMVAASFPAGVRREDPEVEQFLRVLVKGQSVRRLGSAALNLCYVAQGSLDAYWASNVQAWDVAAGMLIAQRAGAECHDVSGAAFDLWQPRPLVTATPALAAELLECIHQGP
jgi:myo-inositol-1(or 4)-monophosphatase